MLLGKLSETWDAMCAAAAAEEREDFPHAALSTEVMTWEPTLRKVTPSHRHE